MQQAAANPTPGGGGARARRACRVPHLPVPPPPPAATGHTSIVSRAACAMLSLARRKMASSTISPMKRPGCMPPGTPVYAAQGREGTWVWGGHLLGVLMRLRDVTSPPSLPRDSALPVTIMPRPIPIIFIIWVPRMACTHRVRE